MKFIRISLYEKSNDLRCFCCTFELEGLGEVEMKDFNVSTETTEQLKKELTMQIMKRLGRDFKEQFDEKEALHRDRNQAQEVLSVQEQSSAPVADMLGQQPVSSDMP